MWGGGEMKKFFKCLIIFNYALIPFVLYVNYDSSSIEFFAFCCAWIFNACCCHLRINIDDNEIRGLENQVKMRDDRIEELLADLDKFDK